MAITKAKATIRMTIGKPDKDGKNFNYCVLEAEAEDKGIPGSPALSGAQLFDEAIKECRDAYIKHFHKEGGMHNSTPLSIDRFELEKRIKELYYSDKGYEDPLHVIDDVLHIIDTMAEEGDAAAAYMEDSRDIPAYGDADSNVGDK